MLYIKSAVCNDIQIKGVNVIVNLLEETEDSLPYMDGTDIRVPFFTSFDAKTGQWIIENHGVDPDILIDNDPIKERNGED